VDLERDPVEGAQLAVVAARERANGPLLERVDAVCRDPEGLGQSLDLDRDRVADEL